MRKHINATGSYTLEGTLPHDSRALHYQARISNYISMSYDLKPGRSLSCSTGNFLPGSNAVDACRKR